MAPATATKCLIVKDPVEEVLPAKDRAPGFVLHPIVAKRLQQAGMTEQIDEVGIYPRAFDLSRHRHKVLVEL